MFRLDDFVYRSPRAFKPVESRGRSGELGGLCLQENSNDLEPLFMKCSFTIFVSEFVESCSISSI